MAVKLIVITVVVFFITTVIFLTGKTSENAVTSEKKSHAFQSEKNISPLNTHEYSSENESEIKLLIEENSKLKNTITDLKSQLTSYANQNKDINDDPGEDPMIDIESPLFNEMNNYQLKMQSEELDEDWRHTVEPIIEKIRNSVQMEGTSLIASECRSTLCRLDFMMEEVNQSDSAESYLLDIFPENLNGSVKIQKVPYENGATGMVVFYSRDGNFTE